MPYPFPTFSSMYTSTYVRSCNGRQALPGTREGIARVTPMRGSAQTAEVAQAATHALRTVVRKPAVSLTFLFYVLFYFAPLLVLVCLSIKKKIIIIILLSPLCPRCQGQGNNNIKRKIIIIIPKQHASPSCQSTTAKVSFLFCCVARVVDAAAPYMATYILTYVHNLHANYVLLFACVLFNLLPVFYSFLSCY